MKSLADYLAESDAPTNQTGGVAAPDSKPIGGSSSSSTFMGHPCIEVDNDTYNKCVRGKVPFARWHKYVDDEQLRTSLRTMYQKHKRVVVKNSSTGAMSFVK